MSVEQTVKDRYSEGARERQEALCCPVDYDAGLLALLPQEIIDKDYGCGDPSRYVRPGDTVLDLGSGGGKICYMAAQIVGDSGGVIGVDMTDDMLALARQYQGEMADKLGGDRVRFHKGYIQDLALDLDALQQRLQAQPVAELADWQALEAWKKQQRAEAPMIADNSVDLVISNCVLNLVDEADRSQLISEIFRVLKPGGRVAISDIVSDEVVPQHLREDGELWSGCISGAFHERGFLDAFASAGFIAVGYDKWDEQPWQVVEGIEFRSVTLTAVKPSAVPNRDLGQAVLYKGPFAEVVDERGIRYPRGERIAVGSRSFDALSQAPYAEHFVAMAPAELVDAGAACCSEGKPRAAAATRGGSQRAGGTDSVNGGGGCC